MKTNIFRRSLTITLAGLMAFASLCIVSASSAQPEPAPKTHKFPTKPPKGAIILIGKSQKQFANSWYQRYTKDDAAWVMNPVGVFTPNGKDITSKRDFGDIYLHVEFRCPTDANGNPITDGNSGVGLMGRYEVQIFNSYGEKTPDKDGCGALYDQKPALVNACKKAGEWQTYDILFHAPRFDADGKVIQEARVTVYQNNSLIQDNAYFEKPTGIQYGEYKNEVPVGPLVLQGDHNPVSFRNVWLIPRKSK